MFVGKRMLIIVGVVGVLILGALGFVFALLISQANATSSASALPAVTIAPTTPTVVTTPAAASDNRACALGIVQSVDSQHQSFIVSEAKGKKTITVTVNAATTFRKQGNAKASFAILAVGQRVRVTAQGGCDRTASTFAAQAVIVVVPAASPTPTPSPAA